MKAAFTDGNRQIEIRNVSDPVPGEGEVIRSGGGGSVIHFFSMIRVSGDQSISHDEGDR